MPCDSPLALRRKPVHGLSHGLVIGFAMGQPMDNIPTDHGKAQRMALPWEVRRVTMEIKFLPWGIPWGIPWHDIAHGTPHT